MFPGLMTLFVSIVFIGILWTLVLHPSLPGMQIMSGPLKANQPQRIYCSSRNCSIGVERATRKHSDGETPISNVLMSGFPEINADWVSMQGMDAEERYRCETRNHHEACSTSGTQPPENSRVLQRNISHGLGERSKCKCWRGRQEKLDLIPEILSRSSKEELSTTNSLASTRFHIT